MSSQEYAAHCEAWRRKMTREGYRIKPTPSEEAEADRAAQAMMVSALRGFANRRRGA